MQIKANEPVKNLKGEPLKTGKDNDVFTVGMAIAEVLLAAKQGGKMKMFILAEKFYKNKTVEIDSADLALVKDAVEKADPMTVSNLISGQILVMLDSLKEEKGKGGEKEK
jgi:hypothetical protein